MKSLKDQIKFIDKELLKLYGFTGITDYTHSICTSDPDTIPIDLDKLNGLIDKFRKVFHSKNFSLHKTQYKILTKSQAVCLLKTCLEVTSIPFDLSLKSKKKYLRLISKNNILEDYINTLKMAENGSFKEEIKNEKITNHNNLKPNDNILLEKGFGILSGTDQMVEPVQGFKQEYVKPPVVTKSDLLANIKKTTQIEFIMSPSKLFVTNSLEETSIEINMTKTSQLVNRNIKSFCIEIISKKFNGEPIISENFINSQIPNLKYEIVAPYNKVINYNKFTSGSNCLMDEIIILNPYLKYHDIILRLKNIDPIVNIIDNLEFKINFEYVNFYKNFEMGLLISMIEQEICIDFKYNLFCITGNLCGMRYNNFQNEIEFRKLQSGDKTCSDTQLIKLDKNAISNETAFTGIKTKENNYEGFHLDKYSQDIRCYIIDLIILFYGFDFVSWNFSHHIINRALNYTKIVKNKKYSHEYVINLNGDFHTISELEIMIPEIKLSNLHITKVYYNNSWDENFDVDWSIIVDKIKINIKPNHHIRLIDGSKHLILSIETESAEEPIQKDIVISGKVFYWTYDVCMGLLKYGEPHDSKLGKPEICLD